MTRQRIVLAGATGDLGRRVARALVSRGASVTALVRRGSPEARVQALRQSGCTLAEVDFERIRDLERACAGAACVVSTLSGLRDVIVQAQTLLLDAAVAAGCPRFIPSDYAIDYTKLPAGNNRNFDLRREFKARLDSASIGATSILSGAFAELLTGDAPFLVPALRRVVVWGRVNPKLDFTTKGDVAAFTAAAALDASTPRILRVAGDRVTADELAALASEVSQRKYRVFHAGSLEALDRLIRVARAFDRQQREVFPPWQGMQYMRDMYSGQGALEPLDNDRYPDTSWTSVREVLSGDPRLARRRSQGSGKQVAAQSETKSAPGFGPM
jgi:uncharacterized protein YbjT (DUF2867 family)